MKARRLSNPHLALFVILFIVILASCASVQLIAPYDERIEKGITELQRNTTTFFVKVERQGGSDINDYKNHIEFYDHSKVATKSLFIRAGATAQNKKTEEQILLLMQKFELLEKQHKNSGLTPNTIPTLESSFDQLFRSVLTLEVAKKEPNGKKKGE